MATTEDYKNTLVAFHIGRGGRFHNGGYWTYMWEIESFQDLISFRQDYLFRYDTDEDDKPLPEDKQYITDGGGKIMVEGKDIFADTGTLDFDGEYDTDIVCSLYDCPSAGEQALLRAFKNGDISKSRTDYNVFKEYLIDAMLLDEEDCEDEQ